MEKIVQIITIPLDKDGWEKGDITLCVDMIMSSAESIGTMKIATYDYPAPNPYHEAQQLLVLSDKIQLGDTFLDGFGKIDTYHEGEFPPASSGRKIIASYPQIEGTLPISKETIQQWIDNGTPGEGSVDMNHWCKDGTSVAACERNCDCSDYPEAEIDPQGNLQLEFNKHNSFSELLFKNHVDDTKYHVTSDIYQYVPNTNKEPIVPTDEEIKQKASEELLRVKNSEKSILEEDNLTPFEGLCITSGFYTGYKQALKDLGYDN